MIRIIRSSEAGTLLTRKAARFDDAENAVRPIIEAVRTRGDAAVREYAAKFDDYQGNEFRIGASQIAQAADRLSPQFRDAVLTAAASIRSFAELQVPQPFTRDIGPGIRAGQIVRPLDTVCGYIPAGRYPLPSTVMMTVIPAQVAGVRNVCITSPRAVPEILGTAGLLGGVEVYQLGGAHAIAAFAFGTETVPRADRIVGPGNIYVAAAKKLLAGEVGIDFVAGPTEILIIADDGNARWIAADMLAQAEHDTDASAVLLTTSHALAEQVSAELERQLPSLPTAAVAREAIDRNSAIIIVDSPQEAVELSNRFAPEHLSLHDPSLLDAVQHAGSVFLGPLSPEAAGDYASGPNHVLPTTGAARVRGGLSAADYVKVISTQQLAPEALSRLCPAVTTLARAEGLEAHARSMEVRLDA
ncbi:MAG TPA: histidinol dehydrogenase [Bryobacteraceae bacterium]|nr:histidinol dehydrogenase [Bryobacteraceae bacterium]